MSEIKRGIVMLLQAGDPEISGAIAEGIAAGKGLTPHPALCATFPSRGRLLGEAEGGLLTKAELARRVKDAVGNTRTPGDYAMLLVQAEMAYGESVYEPTRLRRGWEKLVTLYALAVYRLHERIGREHYGAEAEIRDL